MNEELVIVEQPTATTVEVRLLQVVAAMQPEVFVVAAGQQGPAGAQGAPGSTGATVETATAGVILSGHRMVTLDSSENAIYADNLTPAHFHRVLGMTTGAAALGAPVDIVTAGDITEPSWAWDVTLPVFLGANGLLTQTPPTSPAFQLIVGFPRTSTKLFIRLREPIVLN